MPTVTITETLDGQTVAAAPGDRITVRLPENPTTGFRWHCPAAPQCLTPESDSFEPVRGAQVGGGGTRVLSYRALRAGTDLLCLVLWRAWEGESSIARRFEVTIAIRAADSAAAERP